MSVRLMYSPTLLRSIAQVVILNKLPSQDMESATKSGKKLFPGYNLMKIYRVHSENYAKRWKISSEDWWGLDYQTIHYLEEGD